MDGMPFIWFVLRIVVYTLTMLLGAGITSVAERALQKRKARKEAAYRTARDKNLAERFK